MTRKVIATSDGLKLVNRKTGKLAGSVSTSGKKAPTASVAKGSKALDTPIKNKTLYHGTSVSLKPGDIILPPEKREEPIIRFPGTTYEEKRWPSSNFTNLSKPHLVYATEDLLDAKYFAFQAATPSNKDFQNAYVYEVEPLGETKIKQIYPSNETGVKRFEHQSKEGFRVIRLVASKNPDQVPAENIERLERLKGFFALAWKEK